MNEPLTPHEDHEGRLVRLETGLSQVVGTVDKLADTVRSQGESFEREMRSLTVAVTRAGAPREFNWQTLIAAVGLFCVLGSAAYYPMNMRISYAERNTVELKATLQRETELLFAQLRSQSANVDKEMQNVGDRVIGRVNEYDRERHSEMLKDLDELRQWRMWAMRPGVTNRP